MSTSSGDGQRRSALMGGYVVMLFALTNALSYADRAMINLLIQPIKHDLGFTDVQIGMLTGVAFGAAYSIFSLPVGWLADRFPRNWIAATGAAIWTVATAASGLASSFGALFAFRIGVGSGEAVVYPTAMTSVADAVPRRFVPHGIGAVITGGFVGSGLALIGGGMILGVLGEHGTLQTPFGAVAAWRLAFLCAAAPGLPLALLLGLSIRDSRGAIRTSPQETAAGREGVLRYLLSNGRLVGCLVLGMAFCNLFASGQAAWMPTLVIRTYGMSASNAGLAFGVTGIVSGCIGPLLAAHVSDRMRTRGHQDALIRTAIICVLAAMPCAIGAPLAPSPTMAIVLQALGSLLLYGPYTMAAAAIQEIVPESMRGRFTAGYLFVINLVGLGLGPLLVGLITDAVFGDESKLRYSVMLWGLLTLPFAVLLLRQVLRPLKAMTRRDAAAPAAPIRL
jgi:MFS family permease